MAKQRFIWCIKQLFPLMYVRGNWQRVRRAFNPGRAAVPAPEQLGHATGAGSLGKPDLYPRGTEGKRQ